MTDVIEEFTKELEAEGAKWLESAKEIGGDFLNDLKGKKKDLAIETIKSMAEIKVRAAKGEHVGRRLGHCEATLQNLATITSLKTVQGFKELMQATAGPATRLFTTMFSRILNTF